jgi:WD40 repeat protein
MRIRLLRVLVLLVLTTFTRSARSQKLPSEGRGASTSQVVMLSVDNKGCAAGVVVGYDEKSVYAATAAHIVRDSYVDKGSSVTVRFYDLRDTHQGRFFSKSKPRDAGDLAVVVIDRDAAVNKFLDQLDFAMLPPVNSLLLNAPVKSIGCFGGTFWSFGSEETLLAPDQGYLHVQSNVNEGQSGGGLFNESWELIGMPLDVGVNQISARPIAAVLNDLRVWGVPVLLTIRPLKDRVMGAEELARENARLAQRAIRRNLAQTLATQSEELRLDSPVRSLLLSVEAVNATRGDGLAIAPAREALAKSLQGISGTGLSGHAETIFRATFSADDSLLATASHDGVIRVWSLADPSAPKCLKVLREPGQGDYVVSEFIAFDKQSKELVSQAFGKEAHLTSPKVWPLDTSGLNPEPKWLIPDHTPATALAVSQGRNLIAVADVTNRLSLYSLGKTLNRSIRVLSIPNGYLVKHISFSRDDTVVIAGTSDARVLIWDLSSAEAKPVAAFDTGHKQLGPFHDHDRPDLDLLDISDDHSLLLTGSSHWSIEGSFADPTVRVWPLQKLVPKGAPWVIDQSEAEASKVVIDAFFDKSSRFVIGATWSGTVNVWDLSKARFDGKPDTGPPFAHVKAGTYSQADARSLDRALLVLTQGKGVSVTRTKDLESGQPLDNRKLSGLDSSVGLVELSDSARFLVAGATGGTARLWDLARVDPLAPASSLVPNPYSEVRAIQLSRSGHLAITLRGTSLEFWDIGKPTEPKLRYTTDIDVKEFGDCIVCRIVISPDDRWIAVQDTVKNRSHIVEIGVDGPARREFTVAARTWRNTGEILFSPDGRLLFVEETPEIRVVYNLSSTSLKREVFSDSGSYFHPIFSPDAKWVCFRRFVNEFHDPIGRDKTVGFMAPTDAIVDRTKRIPLTGFATEIGSVEFSPDGHWLALSGNYNHPLRERDDRYVQVMHLGDSGWTRYADLDPIEYAAQSLRFSADGHWLFTGSGDITLGDRNVSARIWNLSERLTPTSGQQLPNVVWNLKLVEFSPDSQWLITVSGAESYARLWTLKRNKLEFVSELIGPQPKLNNHWSAVFSPDSQSVVLWTTDDATPFYWRLNDTPITERGSAIPNGDREIEDVQFSDSGRALTILNSGGTTTGTSGTEGAHFTFIDLTAFPAEDSYAAIPASAGAYSHIYREDLGLIFSAGEALVAAPTDVDSQLRRAESEAGRNLSWEEWIKSPLRGQYRPTFPSILVNADVIAGQAPSLARLVADHREAEAERLKQDLVRWTRQLDDAETCNNVAWELAKERDVADSLELSSCALHLSPDEPNYHDTRGVALALGGRRDEAIAEFEYFIRNAQGIERFAKDIPVRQQWIELLRSGKDPFAGAIE